MGRSCEENGRRAAGREREQTHGETREREVMKCETAVGGLREKRQGESGRGMEKKNRR